MNKFDYIIVGAGFAGATIAERLSSKNHKILLIDKRDHIGGNAYDYFNESGIIVHKYGPHIFHTSNKEVWDYIKQFSDFFHYNHKVLGNIDGTLVPIPFNFKSLELTYPVDKADKIKELLIKKYPNQKRISILDLLNDTNEDIKQFGAFVYNKVFVYYTSKQWGFHPDKIDKGVINRVPVVLGYEDTYFSDAYQYMPSHGFTNIFRSMIYKPNIEIKLNTNIKDHIEFKDDGIYIDKVKFNGKLIYTGAIDELFNYCYGVLPYRSLDIVLEEHNVTHFQPQVVVNYTTSELFTRISEYKYFLNQNIQNKTIIAKEFSKSYSLNSKTDPYYPINNKKNNELYLRYKALADKYGIVLCGRLADYHYYNMDMAIARALEIAKNISH